MKTTHIAPQNQQVPQQTRISVDKLLKEVKRVCDEAILANYNHLPTMFADKQDFATFRKSAEQKYLPANTFNVYKRSQDQRLKTIEEKLNHRFSLFSTNRSKHKTDQTRKATFNIVAIIQYFKDHNPQWLIRNFVSLFIAILAVFLFCSIRP